MSAVLSLAVAQFAPVADRVANLDRIRLLAAQAASRGARVLVLPEYSSFFVDPFDASLRKNAEPGLDGPFVRGLREIALREDLTLVAGLVEAADADRVHNTVVAVDASGVVASYRKQHLYDAFGQCESDWVAPGDLDEPQTFTVDGVVFGIMTCYDLRFPEAARRIVDAGAHVILVPAEWVRGPLKEQQWQTLLAARAIESTAFVAAADHPAPLGVGHSAILDPQGVTLAGLAAGEGLAVSPIDLDELARIRAVNPALQLRRYRVLPR